MIKDKELEEGKAEEFNVNGYPTQRTNRGSYVNSQGKYKENTDYKALLSSSRATSNSKAQRYTHKEDKYERDSSINRDLSMSHERESCKVSELREKIRRSFLTTRGNNEILETSMASKLNDSNSMVRVKPERSEFMSRMKERPEMNTTISSLKQSIELLKYSKAQNDKSKNARFQDSYEKLNSSFAGKIRNQSDRLSGSFLKQLDNDESHNDIQPKKTDGIISRIVAEKMRSMEKKFQERQKSIDRSNIYDKLEKRNEEKDTDRSPKVLGHDYIKQKLNKLGMTGRSISTNRTSYVNKNEEDNSYINESFRRDTTYGKGLNRIGSSNKFSNKSERERVVSKETEESLQIFRALKNIYQKN